MNYKIISFSVWGNDDIYIRGCFENITLAMEIYPDWVCRFYFDETVNEDTIKKIEETGSQIRIVKNKRGDWEGLFWRFFPASEEDVDIFISRDVDSRLNYREKAAVDEWIESGHPLHCMRDHLEHNVPMLGGMWGCTGNFIKNIYKDIFDWGIFDHKGCDQEFLRKYIWEPFKHTAIVHDSNLNGIITPYYEYIPLTLFGDHYIKDFPNHAPLKHGTHVGEIIKYMGNN